MVIGELTVAENLFLGRRPVTSRGLPVPALSGGNQQRVAMARALATDPRVLVLIDPTAGVDVRSRRALLDVALRARAEGRAVLLVSDQPEDPRACDRVLVMAGGFVTAAYEAGWAERELITAIEGVPPGHG